MDTKTDATTLAKQLLRWEARRLKKGRALGLFSTPEVADALQWAPTRLDRAAELLEALGWLKAKRGPAASPYVTIGLALTSEGKEAIQRGAAPLPVSAAPLPVAPATSNDASGVRIFISHSSRDERLAASLIALIEAGIEAPDGSIRCTSVDGYRLEGGSSSAEVLRDNLRRSSVVLGLLTQSGLESSYVLMELGAAWGFDKTAIPLLVPGVALRDLPGPFRDIQALRLHHQPDMAGLVTTVARRTSLPQRANPPKLQAALAELSDLVDPPDAGAQK